MMETRTEVYSQEEVLDRLKGCEPLQALIGEQGYLASLIKEHGLENPPEKLDISLNIDCPGTDPKL